MSDLRSRTPEKKSSAEARRERLANELRANLIKRKAQARAQAHAAGQSGPHGADKSRSDA